MTPAPLVLENKTLRAEFCATSGALQALVCKRTGWAIQRRRELGKSFDMLVPLPGRRNNRVQGHAQAAPCITADRDRPALTFVWNRVRSQHGGEHAITFTGIVTLTDSGLHFEGRVDNHSASVVETVTYPALGDLAPPAPGGALVRHVMSGSGTASLPVYPKPAGMLGYWGTDHYVVTPCYSPDSPFLLVADPRQGVYIGCHDDAMRETVGYFFEHLPGYWDSFTSTLPPGDTHSGVPVRMELHCVHASFVQPGERYTLAPMVLQPYTGDWHAGVDLYKAWRGTRFAPRKAPPVWATDMQAWRQYQINSAEDDLRMPYRGLGELARECAENGIAAIQLTGWHEGGQDRNMPRLDTDPRLGTPCELRQAIAEAKTLGVRIIPQMGFVFADRSTDWYRKTGHRLAARNPLGDVYDHYGNPQETYSQHLLLHTRQLVPMCMGSPEYQAVLLREHAKLLALQPDGLMYDESFHAWHARYCFDPSHGHRAPAHNSAGDIALLRALGAAEDAAAPDFFRGGALPFDALSPQYALLYFHFERASGWPIQRYLDPFVPMLAGVSGMDDRTALNKCLQYRYLISYEPLQSRGRLSDFPRTLAYGKQIDALRRRYRDCLWDAEFRDTQGAAVTRDGAPFNSLDYAVYHRTDGRRAVVVCNVEAVAATVQVTLDGDAHGPLVQVTPEHPDTMPTDGTVILPPHSVGVVLET